MLKTKNEKVIEKLIAISDLLGVEVKFVSYEKDQNQTVPGFNIDAIISKIISLLVFSGTNVPSSFAPSYNCVHADVEFWKNAIKDDEEPTATSAVEEVNGNSKSE